MKFHYFIFLTIYIFLSGCRTKASKDVDSDYYTIDYEQYVEEEKPMLLSEIADSIEYIELRTPEDIIFSNITNIIPLNEDLIICASEGGPWRGVYKFRRDGQFVKRIGGIGQSLGEYLLAMDFQIDKNNKEIIIIDISYLHFYDFDGSYLRSTKQQTSSIKTSIGVSDSILWIHLVPQNKEKYIAVAIAHNENGDTVATIPDPFYKTKTSDFGSIIPTFPAFYHKNEFLYFKPNDSYDTLWQISGKNKELYAYINMGKYKLPIENERWYSTVEFDRLSHNYWAINIIAEDDRYIFLRSETRNRSIQHHKYNYIVYDKMKRNGFATKDKKDLKITDDIMGGPNVWPLWITEKYYISTISRDELQKQIDTGNYSPSEPLKSQLSRIGENANQIIILCHRKS